MNYWRLKLNEVIFIIFCIILKLVLFVVLRYRSSGEVFDVFYLGCVSFSEVIGVICRRFRGFVGSFRRYMGK